MHRPTEEELAGQLIGIIADGFNRSLGALRDLGAVDTREMGKHYQGAGTKYYDVVTAKIEYTARHGAAHLLKTIFRDGENPHP